METIMTICKNCGVEFFGKPERQQFCKQSCFVTYVKANGSLNPRKPLARVTKLCEYCGKSYKVHPYRKNTSRFCSSECHNLTRLNRVKLNCDYCNKEFETIPAEIRKGRRFCSESCSKKGNRISTFQKEVGNFLASLVTSITDEVPFKTGDTIYFIDYIINKSIVLECFGDYWHCNPTVFSENYFHKQVLLTAKDIWKKDKQKIDALERKFKKVIVVWERDWREDQENVKRYLKNEVFESKKDYPST